MATKKVPRAKPCRGAPRNPERKRYYVSVESPLPGGYTVCRPLTRSMKPGAFPAEPMSRFQAKKLRRRALVRFPNARLGYERILRWPEERTHAA